MKTIFINVILNLFQDLILEKARCRNKFGMTKGMRGFTLIELLVVISIIGILAAFLMANFVGIRQRARDGVRKADLRQIQAALELYRSDQGQYPSLPACGNSLTDEASPPVIYMQKIPCDPLPGAIYTYNSPSGNATYSIMACLENKNDSQLDNPLQNCATSSTYEYTLQNP